MYLFLLKIKIVPMPQQVALVGHKIMYMLSSPYCK